MKVADWLEEIQDYIDSSSDIDYTKTTDLFIGQVFTFEDILTVPSLTLYEEGGDFNFGRIEKQNRNIRFAFRDSSYESVMSRMYTMYKFMIKNRVIVGTNFKSQIYRIFRTPSFTDITRSNIYIADFVLGFMVTAN